MRSKKHPGGRPSKLSPDVQAAIVASIRQGISATDACTLAGIGISTYGDWMRRGDAEDEGQYCDFAREVHRASALLEVELVASLNRAAREGGDWRAALYLLERAYPEHWGRRDRHGNIARARKPSNLSIRIVQQRPGERA